MKKIDVNDIYKLISEKLPNKTQEYQRLFHGRGGCYEGFEFLTIDTIDTILYVAIYEKIDTTLEDELLTVFHKLFDSKQFVAVVLQRRYLQQEKNEVLFGMLPQEVIAVENGLKYHLNMTSNQNIGFFADMKEGRTFVREQSYGKNVLNLFSYTCAFSVSAAFGGASHVVNVDMSKSALTTGRKNHHLNSLDTKKVSFMPYNILKSWNRIKKAGPYDMIIIDPPSFQKGSFAATKDYVKIIKRLDDLAAKECTVLACLNAPELTTSFLKEIFEEYAPIFTYQKRLENPKTFESLDEERTLKNLVFYRNTHESY